MAEAAAPNQRIAIIAGDGIGQEVIPAAIKVLGAVSGRFGMALEFKEFPWGSEFFFQNGSMMPGDGIVQLSAFDAIFLGAVGHPRIPDHVTLDGLLLPIRRQFQQYVNLRPAVLYEGVQSPLAAVDSRAVDMLIVRENTEGEYAQIGGFLHQGTPNELAVQSSVFTRTGIERILRYAFQLASAPDRRGKVSSITKSNAQGFGMVLWDRIFNEIRAEYPSIETESILVDAATIHMVRRPQSFDVIVASNLFGDILSDLAAAVTGSIGLAASANLDPTRTHPSMFEPVHGSAPDIAGKGVANPLAAFLSGAMMVRHLGHDEAARAVEAAVRSVLATGRVRTADLGGVSTTDQVTDAVLDKLASLPGLT
jgi:tartrate dehydrogenase/decarboxylase / D-malate dehydrogenase